MAEIGLIHFAQVARQVAEAALPRYRSKYLKYPCVQSTLLALLWLILAQMARPGPHNSNERRGGYQDA
jgi:hypothetical protein